MWLIIGVIVIGVLSSIMTNTNTKLKYSELIAKINEGKVESIVIDADGTSATVQLSDDKVKKQVNIPNMENFMNYTDEFIKNGAFTLEESSESVFSIMLGLLTPFGILIIFFIFWFFMMGGAANTIIIVTIIFLPFVRAQSLVTSSVILCFTMQRYRCLRTRANLFPSFVHSLRFPCPISRMQE